jgi:DNA repair exonuclease SbcCD ATPase subunit
MEKTPEEEWRALSEQVLTDLKEWRRTHPKATLREIEDEVHSRMSRLEAQLIQETAQESKSRTWSAASPRSRPTCPVCGTPLQARGKRERTLQAAGGEAVTLTREYGTCPTCGTGFFPPR